MSLAIDAATHVQVCTIGDLEVCLLYTSDAADE